MCREAGWATAHFPALGHDTTYCIVIGKGTGAQGCTVGGHDKASSPTTRPHHTTNKGPRHGRPATGLAAALAHMAWPLQCVAIQNFVS